MRSVAEGLTSLEVGDDRENASVVVLRRRELQLHEDAVDMLLDGAVGHQETACDAGVRATLGHEPEHFVLTRRQSLEGIVSAASADQLLDEAWVDDRTSSADSLDALDELSHVGDPGLEQVADSLATGE